MVEVTEGCAGMASDSQARREETSGFAPFSVARSLPPSVTSIDLWSDWEWEE